MTGKNERTAGLRGMKNEKFDFRQANFELSLIIPKGDVE